MAAAPTVSVIVVTRDRPLLLADALRSVGAQTLPPLEVRIANDGECAVSDAIDGLGVLEVTLLETSARQAGAARNAAARGARGEVLALLDDDDRWLPGHLEGLAAAFANPAVELAYRDVAVVREQIGAGGERIEHERRVIARDWDPDMMRHDDYIPPSALAIRRSAFEALGGFDESFACSEDWDLLMRAAARRAPRRVPGVTAEVRMRESGNSSADFGPERIACLLRLAQRHGLPTLIPKTFWEVAAVAGAGARA